MYLVPVITQWVLVPVCLILTWLAGDRWWKLHELVANLEAKNKRAAKIIKDLESARDGLIEVGDSLPKTFPLRELERETQVQVTREIREARKNGSVKVGDNGVPL